MAVAPPEPCEKPDRTIYYPVRVARKRMEYKNFDQEYVRRLIEGDGAVEAHFVDYFSKLLTAKLRSSIRSPELRKDIQQETFLRVLTILRRGGLEQPERLGAFVHSVCRNVMLEQFRGESRTGDSLEGFDPVEDRADAEAQLVSKARMTEVRQILDTLPGKDRNLLVAVFLEDRDKDDVCRQFEVDRGYLRVLLHRAKSKFRNGFVRSAGNQ